MSDLTRARVNVNGVLATYQRDYDTEKRQYVNPSEVRAIEVRDDSVGYIMHYHLVMGNDKVATVSTAYRAEDIRKEVARCLGKNVDYFHPTVRVVREGTIEHTVYIDRMNMLNRR